MLLDSEFRATLKTLKKMEKPRIQDLTEERKKQEKLSQIRLKIQNSFVSLSKAEIWGITDDGKEIKCEVQGNEPFFIGRAEKANHLVLPELTISRKHCVIIPTVDGYILEDLESKHGTFVNDMKIEKLILRSGDTIKIGGTNLVFRLAADKNRR